MATYLLHCWCFERNTIPNFPFPSGFDGLKQSFFRGTSLHDGSAIHEFGSICANSLTLMVYVDPPHPILGVTPQVTFPKLTQAVIGSTYFCYVLGNTKLNSSNYKRRNDTDMHETFDRSCSAAPSVLLDYIYHTIYI